MSETQRSPTRTTVGLERSRGDRRADVSAPVSPGVVDARPHGRRHRHQPVGVSTPRRARRQQVEGIGYDRATLSKAGVERAVALAAVTNGDDGNIVVARTGREAFGVARVFARIYDMRVPRSTSGSAFRPSRPPGSRSTCRCASCALTSKRCGGSTRVPVCVRGTPRVACIDRYQPRHAESDARFVLPPFAVSV